MKGCYVTVKMRRLPSSDQRTEGLQFEPRSSKHQSRSRLNLFACWSPTEDSTKIVCRSMTDSIRGSFGEFQVPDVDEVEWVGLPKGFKATTDMFVQESRESP